MRRTFSDGVGGFLPCVPLGLGCLGMPGQKRRRSGMLHHQSPLSLRDDSVGLGHQLLRFDDNFLRRRSGFHQLCPCPTRRIRAMAPGLGTGPDGLL